MPLEAPLGEQRVEVRSAMGGALATILTEPEFPVGKVLLLHGFSSGKNNKTNLALLPRLLEAGLLVARFDFWGHYDSDGDIGDTTITLGVQDAQAVMAFVDEHTSDTGELPWLGMGSSYGGSVLLGMLGKSRFQAAGLRSPVSDYVEMRRLQLGEDGLRRWETDGEVSLPGGGGVVRLKRAFLDDARRWDLYSQARLHPLPALVVHGVRDEEVPIAQSRRLVDELGEEGDLIELANADHGYSEQADFDVMISAIGDFLSSRADK